METLFATSSRNTPVLKKPGGPLPYPPPNMTWQQDLTLRGIKIVDIGYIAAIYFTLAFFLSTWVDNKLGTFDPKEQEHKPTYQLVWECIFHIYLVGVLVYIVRNVVEKIPFPLDGYQGFIHLKVKELTNATVFVFIFLLYQKNLRDRLDYIRTRLYKKKPSPAPAAILS